MINRKIEQIIAKKMFTGKAIIVIGARQVGSRNRLRAGNGNT